MAAWPCSTIDGRETRLMEPAKGGLWKKGRQPKADARFLAFGLLGSLIAFLIIGLYYGLGGLTQAIAELFGGEGTLARRLVVIVVPLALTAVATVLTLGLWNMVWGRSASRSAW